jgi:hypothetical protein
MTGIDRVRADAERRGLSLPEYLLLHVATEFAMTPEQAAGCITKAAAVDSQAALESCVQKGWVGVSRTGTLVLTNAGMAARASVVME